MASGLLPVPVDMAAEGTGAGAALATTIGGAQGAGDGLLEGPTSGVVVAPTPEDACADIVERLAPGLGTAAFESAAAGLAEHVRRTAGEPGVRRERGPSERVLLALRRAHEASLRRAIERENLRQALALERQRIERVVRELRGPVATMVSALELMVEQRPSEDAVTLRRIIETSKQRIDHALDAIDALGGDEPELP